MVSGLRARSEPRTESETRPGLKDKWEKTVGDVTVTYVTQGARGEGYIHDCECLRGELARAASLETRGNQLSREQIEKLPQFVRLVEGCAQASSPASRL